MLPLIQVPRVLPLVLRVALGAGVVEVALLLGWFAGWAGGGWAGVGLGVEGVAAREGGCGSCACHVEKRGLGVVLGWGIGVRTRGGYMYGMVVVVVVVMFSVRIQDNGICPLCR